MSAASLTDPQSLNMYSYVGNDPVNRMDPDGLFWGKLWRAIKKIVTSKWFQIALAVAIIVIAHYYPNSFFGLGTSSSGAGGAAPVLHGANSAAGVGAHMAGTLGKAATLALPSASSAAALEGVLATSGIASAVSLGLAATLGAGLLAQATPSASDATDSARKALQNNKACRDLFSKGNGLDLLNKLAKKGKIQIADTKIPKVLISTGRLTGAPGIGAYAKDGKIFLNPSSSIVRGTLNPRASVFGGMSSADALGTLVIHELRHLSKDLPAEAGEFYREQSLANSQQVKSNCFPGYGP